ncbi:DUF551 domain-containing protein [Klebsiella pneumoniae]|uniref:DUF551 domain-containing protein n=1 Tax=Klebsiella pneumoniae TaxID=573 RepID=UPI00207316F1|nr:DUF551 domain-containing protein [Klebsiella pneumoniae]
MTNNQLAENSVIQLLNSVKLARDNAERADNRVDHSFYYALTIALEELQERRNADSEPVAWLLSGGGAKNVVVFDSGNAYADPLREVTPLYRHAQPVPVVPEEKSIPNTLSMYAVDAVAAIAEVKGWNACRAAMLQELKKSAGTEAICRSDENVQVLHTKSPAQSDCCPAQNHVSPEQNGDTPAQSQGWIQVSEQMPPSRHEVLVGRWWGEKPRWCCKWATYIPGHPDAQSSGWLIAGASWIPTHWMPLPAAPQEVKSES